MSAPASESDGAGAWAGSVTFTMTETICVELAASAEKTRMSPKYCPAVRFEALTEIVTRPGAADPPAVDPVDGVAFRQPSGPESVCTPAVQFNVPWPGLATANVCGGEAAPPAA